MRTMTLLFAAVVGVPALLPAREGGYEALKEEAERHYREGSYSLAHEVYRKADALELPAAEARWVDFRVADTLWRSQAATSTADATQFERAKAALEALVRDLQRVEDRDRVWAEVHESLGDFHWTRRDLRNWGGAWGHYQLALDFWAGSKDLDLARERYLKIVWTGARPPWREPYYFYGYHGNTLPLEVLESALEIAESEPDRAHARYLVAMTLRHQGHDPHLSARVEEEFEGALKPGRATEWYDDALYHYAEWLASYGRALALPEGGVRLEPDYVKALELFRRFIREHEKGETRYFDQVRSQIENLTRPMVSIGVPSIFLPDSEVQYHLNWRNTKRIDLALYKLDLTRDVDLAGDSKHAGAWIQYVSLAGRERARSWSRDTGDKGDHKPGAEALALDGPLPLGAYLIEARAEGLSARDLVLVTDAALVLKTAGRRALAYLAGASDGAPIPGARVNLWERTHDGRWLWRETAKTTDADGLAVFELLGRTSQVEVFAGAALGDRQAFALGNAHYQRRAGGNHRIYAFTDRPAYRPGEKAQWKLIVRRDDGAVYSTPAGETIEYQLQDPRGAKAAEGTVTLNEFGCGLGSLDLTEAMPLGEYQVHFWDRGRRNAIGQAVLFRLEEYKLPEFRVAIGVPEENGRRKAFRVGERLEVTVSADYYFGGPVQDAQVEVLVYQRPYYSYWLPERDYPWYFEDMGPQAYRHWGWQGQPVVKRESLRTDARGKALVLIDTPRGSNQDFEYRVEARVTDSSRREISGAESVRVTRNRYAVHARAEHSLYRPGDTVRAAFKALDPNGHPVEVEGTVQVTRDTWVEVWVAPGGKEVRGEALRGLRARHPAFPPPGEAGWRLKFRGYEHEDVLARQLKTSKEGEAEMSFVAAREGYYRIAWRSDDRGAPAVRSETVVWVLTGATSDLGYRHGGVEIIVDKDTFRAGQKAPVMIHVPAAGRHVLFSLEGEDLHGYRLVRLDGTVKLLEVEVEEKHVPNVFLAAAMVSDRQLFADTKQVVVPPVEHFLEVEVQADRSDYLPQDPGTLTVTARDHEGKPVAAELAVALVDESVFYIQREYAGDPRQYFFGEKRAHRVQTQSTFQQKGYARRQAGGKEQVGYNEMEKQDVDDFEVREGDGMFGRDGRGDKLARQRSFRGVAGGRGGLLRAEAAANAPGAPAAAEEALSLADGPAEKRFGKAGEAGGEPAVQVRSDFRSTVLWEPSVMTGPDGKATVKVKFPDSLTTWKASARAAGRGSLFGAAAASVRTRLPLIVRLQAPRFFVAGDAAVVSAVINNNTDVPLAVTAALEAEGLALKGFLRDGKPAAGQPDPITVHPGSEARADWLVEAHQAGPARLKATARGGKHADAMERTYSVHEHGIEKLLSKSGKLKGAEARVTLDLPPRKPGSTSLWVQVAPSLAVTMLDALPYLADYPYGCTEQTMSRFLPAVVVAHTLRSLGLPPEAVAEKLFGGIEPEHAAKTHGGRKRDLRQLDEMAQAGLRRLYDFQHADGGWGWWKEGESDHFMTAYVVWGLVLAQGADLDVRPEAIERGAEFLRKEIVEEEDHPDLQAWMLHALAVRHGREKRGEASKFEMQALSNLWKGRDGLNAYTRALFALAAHHYGDAEKARSLARNLQNGVKRDSAPDASVVLEGPRDSQPEVLGTAHWGEDGIWWRWSEGGVEATAFALRALAAIEPGNQLVEPVANWLVKNRRGAQWSNTRDTAIVVLALNDYLKQSGELSPEAEYELVLNGEPVLSRKVAAREALSAPSRFPIDPKRLRESRNEVRIVRKGGKSPLYFAVEARFFSLEEPIAAAGSELFVRREYQKVISRPTLLKGHTPERAPLLDQGAVTSGERVEVALTIEAKNHYEYLVFEDLKPAGLEAVEVRSGTPLYARELKSGAVERRARLENERGGPGVLASSLEDSDYTGRTRWVYQELRDRKVALFIDKLPEGVWEIRYELRAETPGRFHGLPVLGHAMYVPEIRANGAECRIQVEDRKPEPAQRLRRALVGN